MEPLERGAGVEPSRPSLVEETPPAHELFCRHFFRCFFCHVGDNILEDHFCEEGRKLMVEMFDEAWES